MRIEFDFPWRAGKSAMERRLERLIRRMEARMAGELERLTAEVNEAAAVMTLAADAIRNGLTDPAALSALADKLDGASNALSAALPSPAAPVADPVPVVDAPVGDGATGGGEGPAF